MKTRLLIIGGFLGAGKTTLLKAVSDLLQKQGKKVGLITNDQAEGLVDTHVLGAEGNVVQEISGSCFCCNFNGLMDAALYLRDAGCHVIVAEPVGSCTDLSATLVQPIKSYYAKQFDLAPLSVLIDPVRITEVLKSDVNTKSGSGYIYLKQLEEADYLVVNKIDLLDKNEQDELQNFLKNRFKGYQIKWISAYEGEGIESWLETINFDKKVGTHIADVDYDIYAEGEAKMGWYNAEYVISHANQYLIPWADFNLRMLQFLQEVFQHENIEVGHVKMFLSGPSALQANLTGTNRDINFSGAPFSSACARLVVNIRAEADPELLNEIMEDIISIFIDENYLFEVLIHNYLKPDRPTPTHRLSESVGLSE